MPFEDDALAGGDDGPPPCTWAWMAPVSSAPLATRQPWCTFDVRLECHLLHDGFGVSVKTVVRAPASSLGRPDVRPRTKARHMGAA